MPGGKGRDLLTHPGQRPGGQGGLGGQGVKGLLPDPDSPEGAACPSSKRACLSYIRPASHGPRGQPWAPAVPGHFTFPLDVQRLDCLWPAPHYWWGLSFTRPSLDDSLCLVCTFEAAFPGRSLGEGNDSPLHYSWLENPMDRASRQAMYRPWGCRVGLTEHACAMGHKAFGSALRVLQQAAQSLFGGRAPPCVLQGHCPFSWCSPATVMGS